MLALLRNPWVRESIRVGAIMATGDVIAQTFIEQRSFSEIHVKRTLRFAAVGMLFVSPTLRLWYMKLDKIVPPNKNILQRALKKMAYDQLLFSPIFCLAFFGVYGKFNRQSNEQILRHIKKDYFTVMTRNYMLWPLAQIINFSFVPLPYQVIFAQVVAVIWNTYMSKVLNNNA